jgi:hypothetical protein
MTSVGQNSIFYIYYGNPTANSYSNGSDTFVVFDDFERGNNGDAVGGSWAATGCTISTDHAFEGTRSAKIAGHAAAGTNNMYITTTKSDNIIIRYRQWKEDAGYVDFQHGNGVKSIIVRSETDEDIIYLDNALGTVDTTYNVAADAWGLFEYANIKWTPYTLDLIFNNTIICNMLSFAGVAEAPNQGWFREFGAGVGNDFYIDDYIVGKFAVSQPLWGTPGAETTLINPWVIQDVKVFTGYKETDDWLIAIRYVNIYPPYYDSYDVKKYFNLQLLDGATVKAIVPVPVWGNKVGNIYLSAAQATALTYGGSYTIRLYSVADSATFDYALVAGDWWGSDLSQLDSWVITSAAVIGDYYNELLTTYVAGRGEVLNTTGGTIFSAGINGLSTVRPELYQIYTNPINYNPATTGQAQRISMSNWQLAWGADGTIMITRIATWLGIDGGLIGGMFFVIMMLALALLAFPAGNTTAANILSIPCLGLAIWFGLDLVWIIVLALFAAFLLFKNQFMDK